MTARPSTLREARMVEDLSQGDLADAAGIHVSTVQYIERGKFNTEPRPQTIGRLARALGEGYSPSFVRELCINHRKRSSERSDDDE